MLHNQKLWDEWFMTNMDAKFCTFTYKDQRLLGRVYKYGKFLGFSEPGHVPNYEITIKGPSHKEITVDMNAAQVSVKESMDEAEKDCGYTWASRFRFKFGEDMNRKAMKQEYSKHAEKQLQRLKDAEHEWETDPWPMEEALA